MAFPGELLLQMVLNGRGWVPTPASAVADVAVGVAAAAQVGEMGLDGALQVSAPTLRGAAAGIAAARGDWARGVSGGLWASKLIFMEEARESGDAGMKSYGSPLEAAVSNCMPVRSQVHDELCPMLRMALRSQEGTQARSPPGPSTSIRNSMPAAFSS